MRFFPKIIFAKVAPKHKETSVIMWIVSATYKPFKTPKYVLFRYTIAIQSLYDRYAIAYPIIILKIPMEAQTTKSACHESHSPENHTESWYVERSLVDWLAMVTVDGLGVYVLQVFLA